MEFDALIDRDKYSVESTLEKIDRFMAKYRTEDMLKLFSYTSIRLNAESVNSSGYKVSPKLTRNIPFYYALKSNKGHQVIRNYHSLSDEYIDLLDELTQCHHNIVSHDFNGSLHKSFTSYHLDYPSISFRQYYYFFLDNRKVLSKIFSIEEGEVKSLIDSIYLLINFERAWENSFKFNPIGKMSELANRKSKLKYKGYPFFYSVPIKMYKTLLRKYRINHDYVIDKLFLDMSDVVLTNEKMYLTSIDKEYSKYLGIRHGSSLFFMRNLNVLNGLYNYVTNSSQFIEVKGDYLEMRANRFLKLIFGEENVYHGLYDEDGSEQDFIVLYNDLVISLECKSNKFSEPFVNKEKAEKRLKQNFKATIQKAYNQSERIAKNYSNKKFIYYDSDKSDSRNAILDFSNLEIDKFQSVVLTLEQYHTLGTELQLSLSQNEDIKLPLVIDINSLEIIITKCLSEYKSIDKFIEYLIKRSEYYGLVYPSNADELDCFGYFLRYGHIVSGPIEGLYINIGPGYASFVTHILDIDNYVLFSELFGI